MAAPDGLDVKALESGARSGAASRASGAAAGAAGGAGAGSGVADAGMADALPASIVLFVQPEGAADWAEVGAPGHASVARLKELAKAKLEMAAPLHALTLHVATSGASGITLGPALDSTTTVETALGGLTGTIRIVVKVAIAAVFSLLQHLRSVALAQQPMLASRKA